ncbi:MULTISPECIES: SGNH/GDSL hydrolase family protein [Paenibacillus]|uniref:SGNH/GDSL hydrolase family protein n=1 Tax=Paenibacillus TaxID=44249 RepID=UPI0022B92A9C|nr:SGNH/GDSL hydrolase family protein [Paenibacillus caseinilyticus]MCZ8521830.1 SGNH/GDSL hydrolase family protein [Paenibacillus caseinilyticus]
MLPWLLMLMLVTEPNGQAGQAAGTMTQIQQAAAAWGQQEVRRSEREAGSLYNYSKQLAKSRKKVVFGTLGSSVTAGAGSSGPDKTWSYLVYDRLTKDVGAGKFSYENTGFGGYSTNGIVKENKVSVVAKQNLDMIFFETCLINDYGTNVPIDQTKSNLQAIVKQMQTEMPNTRLVLTSANPIKKTYPNKVGLTYEDYVNQAGDYIVQNGWTYFDIYHPFLEEMKKSNLTINDLLVDDAHPNDKGYAIWGNILNEYIYGKR